MSYSNQSLKFDYKDEYGHINPSLKYTYLDGVAVLLHPKCENREVVFDQSVVNYLKEIEGQERTYFFKDVEMTWIISPQPIAKMNPSLAEALVGVFVSGDMIDDGEKVICTNPKPSIPRR